MKILGISCYYHDAAAVLIDNGKIIAAAAEERFSRKKHDSGFPRLSVDFCLRRAKISAKDLNWVVFYEKPFLKFERISLSFLGTAPYARNSFLNAYKSWIKDKLWIKTTIAKEIKIPSDKILFSGHHLSHAASSYYTSPFNSAALLTVDGVGEWTTTAWGEAKNNKIELKNEIRFPHSLGLFYSAFTQFLGFQINEGEFKLMGLAPYGEPRFFEKIDKLIRQSADGSFHLDLKYFNFHLSDKVSFNQKFIDLLNVNPVNPKESDKVVKVYADIASSAQKVLEEKLLVIAKELKRKTGQENLCYAGGVALNGVANWRIFKEAGFKNIFIHPEAGDAGGALGAALYLYHHVLDNKKTESLKHVYFGEENKNEDVVNFFESQGVTPKHLDDNKLTDEVANMLAKGRVIGWVRGRFEWGPRALGARSIIADPRSKKMKDLVNAKIKFREAFRPFAPYTLYEEANKYFAVGADYKQQPLEYMIAVVPVVEKQRKNLGAVTHVDGSARPQFVKKSTNPLYYDIAKKFGRKTGTPVLLNTSFNLKGDPIVNTAAEAYDTFMRSGIDALVVENYLITKKKS
jgi:carbamoyltransferase